MQTIHKAAAVVIRNNEFFMVRKKGKDIWTSLGGKLEPGETEEEALAREIQEEVHCDALIVRKLGDFSGDAAFDDAIVTLSVYLVEFQGEPMLDDPELEEARFIPKNHKELGIQFTQIMEEQIIPFCIKEGLLDW